MEYRVETTKKTRYTGCGMAQVSKLNLPPLDLGGESHYPHPKRARPCVSHWLSTSVSTTRTWAGRIQANRSRKTSRKVPRRLEPIESLPPTKPTALLRTIDAVPKDQAAD
jgi:hypothetical protein